jgi:hypothetical protein
MDFLITYSDFRQQLKPIGIGIDTFQNFVYPITQTQLIVYEYKNNLVSTVRIISTSFKSWSPLLKPQAYRFWSPDQNCQILLKLSISWSFFRSHDRSFDLMIVLSISWSFFWSHDPFWSPEKNNFGLMIICLKSHLLLMPRRRGSCYLQAWNPSLSCVLCRNKIPLVLELDLKIKTIPLS